MSDENPLSLISELTQFNDLNEFMQDAKFERALQRAIKIMVRQDIPAPKALSLMLELQAYSTLFAMKATEYATIKRDKAGTDNNFKKNIYYTAKESVDKLVDCLKYVVRYTG